MPDVGVLNLQIHDNSSTAAEGLGRLAAKLEAVKAATGGVRLGSVATGIKRINDELKNVQPSAIYKLKQLADVLERIGTISGNVGGIRISFGGSSQSVDQIASQMQAARDTAAQATAEFEQIGNRIQEDIEKASNFSGSLGKVNEIVQQTGWSAKTTAEQFYDLFNAWNAFRMSNSLNSGSNPLAIGDGSGAEWAYWKDGAIEVEGTVTDAMESIRIGAGEAITRMQELGNTAGETSEAINGIDISEIAQEVEQAANYMALADKDVASGIDEANSRLEEQIRLRREALEAENQARLEKNYENYRELYLSKEGEWEQQVPEMYGFTPKALEEGETYADAMRITMEEVNRDIDQYIDKLNTPTGPLLRDTIDEALGIGRAAKDAKESASVLANAPEIRETAEQVSSSLRTMQSSTASASKPTTVLTENMKDLDKELKQKKSDINNVSNEAKSLASRFSDLMFGANGLKGAFTRMFPTISGLLTRFKQLMKYRMLRAVIKQISEGFREGVENYYYYSKAIGGDFAPAMDSAASALLQMKNSIGAAAAPLIQSLIPLLQTVVNWFITMVNYANQFFALLRGQTSWSQAVPATASAFGDVENAAHGAGAAIKDLLADWDELNIIQSESSGGGGGGGTQAMEDYLNMFEETNRFDNKIRDIVNWIKDNFNTILSIVEGIGAAILLWKLSRAFGNELSALQKIGLMAGLTLTISGIKLAASAGYDIGRNGLNGQNAKDAIFAVLETMIGGAITGLALTKSWVGGLVGLVIGAGLSIAVLSVNLEQGHLDSLYGDLHKDADEVREELEENILTAEANLQIDIVDAHIKDTSDAENKVTTAINELKKSYPVGVEITPDNASDFKSKVDALVDSTNDLIESSKESLKEIHVPATAAFTSDFVDRAWGNVSGYVTELGNRIGIELNNGITDNVKLDELRQKLLNIANTIRTATKSSEFTGGVSALGANVRANNFANYDRQTIQTYVDEYNKLAAEKMADAMATAQADFTEQVRLVASLEQSIADGAGILSEEKIEEMKRDLETARNELELKYGANGEKISEEAKRLFDEWTLAGRMMYEQDIVGALSAAMEKNSGYGGKRDTLLALAGHNPLEISDENIDKWIDAIQNKMYEAIARETGMDEESIRQMLGIGDIDPLSLFGDSFADDFRNGLAEELYNGDYTQEQKEKILGALGFDSGIITEYVKRRKEELKKAIQDAQNNPDLDDVQFGIELFNLRLEYSDEEVEDMLRELNINLAADLEDTQAEVEVAPKVKPKIVPPSVDETETEDIFYPIFDYSGFIPQELPEMDITQPVSIELETESVNSDIQDKIKESFGSSTGFFGNISGVISNAYTIAQQQIASLLGGNGENGSLFGGFPSEITVHEERDNEQEASNIAEGTKRGNADLTGAQNQTNTYMAQAVRYLSIIAGKSNSSPAPSILGGAFANALAAFGNITGDQP